MKTSYLDAPKEQELNSILNIRRRRTRTDGQTAGAATVALGSRSVEDARGGGGGGLEDGVVQGAHQGVSGAVVARHGRLLRDAAGNSGVPEKIS